VKSCYGRKRAGAPAIYTRSGHVAAGHVPLPISPLHMSGGNLCLPSSIKPKPKACPQALNQRQKPKTKLTCQAKAHITS
jgi:hypothetical protein